MKPTLTELQSSFLEGMVTGRARGAFAASVESTPAFSHVDRLGVYAYAYGARLQQALATDFEAVAKRLGRARFDQVARAYLDAHPSRTWTVGDLGRSFPVYLRGREDLSPGLAELARFEWAVVESLYAEYPPRADDFPDLAAWEPERLAGARLTLDPSVRLLRSGWPVARYWLDRARPGRGIFREGAADELSLVHRTPGWVQAKVLDPVEHVLLDAARAGLPLGEWPAAVTAAGEDLAKFDVSAAFAKWRSEGILISVE